MNIGNLDVESNGQSLTLRMRHVVRGHPGCVLAPAEARRLIAAIEAALSTPTAEACDDEDEVLI